MWQRRSATPSRWRAYWSKPAPPETREGEGEHGEEALGYWDEKGKTERPGYSATPAKEGDAMTDGGTGDLRHPLSSVGDDRRGQSLSLTQSPERPSMPPSPSAPPPGHDSPWSAQPLAEDAPGQDEGTREKQPHPEHSVTMWETMTGHLDRMRQSQQQQQQQPPAGNSTEWRLQGAPSLENDSLFRPSVSMGLDAVANERQLFGPRADQGGVRGGDGAQLLQAIDHCEGGSMSEQHRRGGERERERETEGEEDEEEEGEDEDDEEEVEEEEEEDDEEDDEDRDEEEEVEEVEEVEEEDEEGDAEEGAEGEGSAHTGAWTAHVDVDAVSGGRLSAMTGMSDTALLHMLMQQDEVGVGHRENAGDEGADVEEDEEDRKRAWGAEGGEAFQGSEQGLQDEGSSNERQHETASSSEDGAKACMPFDPLHHRPEQRPSTPPLDPTSGTAATSGVAAGEAAAPGPGPELVPSAARRGLFQGLVDAELDTDPVADGAQAESTLRAVLEQQEGARAAGPPENKSGRGPAASPPADLSPGLPGQAAVLREGQVPGAVQAGVVPGSAAPRDGADRDREAAVASALQQWIAEGRWKGGDVAQAGNPLLVLRPEMARVAQWLTNAEPPEELPDQHWFHHSGAPEGHPEQPWVHHTDPLAALQLRAEGAQGAPMAAAGSGESGAAEGGLMGDRKSASYGHLQAAAHKGGSRGVSGAGGLQVATGRRGQQAGTAAAPLQAPAHHQAPGGKEAQTGAMEAASRLLHSLDRHSPALYLSMHGLAVIPPTLPSFAHLKTLDLSRNTIASVPTGLLPRTLHILDLSHNKLWAVEGLRDLSRLRVLSLSHNRITRIGHGLVGCTALRELYMNNNKVSEVEGLHRLLKLSVLDLSSNKITSTKAVSQLAANLGSLKALNLLSNPIHVNLGNDAFKRFVTGLLPHLQVLNQRPLKSATASATHRDLSLGLISDPKAALLSGRGSSSLHLHHHHAHHGRTASTTSLRGSRATGGAPSASGAGSLSPRHAHGHSHRSHVAVGAAASSSSRRSKVPGSSSSRHKSKLKSGSSSRHHGSSSSMAAAAALSLRALPQAGTPLGPQGWGPQVPGLQLPHLPGLQLEEGGTGDEQQQWSQLPLAGAVPKGPPHSPPLSGAQPGSPLGPEASPNANGTTHV